MTFEVDPKRAVTNSYGVRVTKQKYGGVINEDVIKSASYTFSYDDLPNWTAQKLELVIPANAKILFARLDVLVGFVGGTSYTVGTSKSSDGTVVNATGLFTAANLPVASIGARGNFIIGSGAQVGATVGVDAVEVAVVATGTFTAGKARITIQYMPEGV